MLASASDARILIVDDDEPSIRSIRRILTSGGYEDLHHTTSPGDAMDLVGSVEPALVILDLNMQQHDGFELLTRLRDLDGVHRIWRPVLVVTDDGSKSARQRAWSLGATDYVLKPVDGTEVLLRIQNILRAYTLQQRVAYQNALLEAQVRERTEEIEIAHAEVLVRLALAAEFRDDATGAHTWRVGRLASMLAEVMGIETARLKTIERAARLHDVGKIGIRDAILLKPGRLNPDEFTEMKTHTTIGARLLSNGSSGVLQLAESIARGHHERWDGSGYPDGLAGEAIPLESRLVAVADVFDALTHQRTYKESWPVVRAIEEIKLKRAVHFDPSVIDAFQILLDGDRLAEIERPDDAKFRSILPEPYS